MHYLIQFLISFSHLCIRIYEFSPMYYLISLLDMFSPMHCRISWIDKIFSPMHCRISRIDKMFLPMHCLISWIDMMFSPIHYLIFYFLILCSHVCILILRVQIMFARMHCLSPRSMWLSSSSKYCNIYKHGYFSRAYGFQVYISMWLCNVFQQSMTSTIYQYLEWFSIIFQHCFVDLLL